MAVVQGLREAGPLLPPLPPSSWSFLREGDLAGPHPLTGGYSETVQGWVLGMWGWLVEVMDQSLRSGRPWAGCGSGGSAAGGLGPEAALPLQLVECRQIIQCH